MTLMCHDRPQSPTHKGSFLQGGKSTITNANHRKSAGSPPPKHHPCNNNNNNNSNDANKQAKLEKSNSSSSVQQQQQQQQSSNSSRYKTELCRPFEENGVCKYGDKCQFAHGSKELRSMARHPKYKTELCRTFHSTGLCPYGPRCHFIHNSEQTKKTMITTLAAPAVARPKALDSTGDSPPPSRDVSPTSPKNFSDLYRQQSSNVFFPADSSCNLLNNFHQRYLDLPLFEFNNDVYDSINVFNDKRMSDLDNHSFQTGPVLDLFPLEQQPLTPTSPPIDANFFRLPIFDAINKL